MRYKYQLFTSAQRVWIIRGSDTAAGDKSTKIPMKFWGDREISIPIRMSDRGSLGCMIMTDALVTYIKSSID